MASTAPGPARERIRLPPSESHYDVLLVGTDLPTSILSAALARASVPSGSDAAGAGARTGADASAESSSRALKVLHVDENEYYGGRWAGLTLRQMCDWAAAAAASASASNDRKGKGREVAFSFPYFQSQGATIPEALAKLDRHYSLPLTPTLLASSGPALDALVRSNVAAYATFRLLEETVIAASPAASPSPSSSSIELRHVPSSKEDIFKDRSLSLLEKRKLMKFLQSVLQRAQQPEQEARRKRKRQKTRRSWRCRSTNTSSSTSTCRPRSSTLWRMALRSFRTHPLSLRLPLPSPPPPPHPRAQPRPPRTKRSPHARRSRAPCATCAASGATATPPTSSGSTAARASSPRAIAAPPPCTVPSSCSAHASRRVGAAELELWAGAGVGARKGALRGLLRRARRRKKTAHDEGDGPCSSIASRGRSRRTGSSVAHFPVPLKQAAARQVRREIESRVRSSCSTDHCTSRPPRRHLQLRQRQGQKRRNPGWSIRPS